MSRLYNDPARFAEEAAEGFVSAHRHWVRAVPGGVIRRAATPSGQVAVVVGGGSGHYPAFAGLVGEGLAAGAVLGNVFASPSAAQVVSVARAAENGGGVMLSYGNYAGDVLNFATAQERLRGDGIACETVRVTDDISSAPGAESDRRRGVAGDLMVFKVAAAAASEGRPLGEVAELATAANERTRTLGVAFSGCTLPGADHPLFSVPAGRMAVGLGIHGEPGLCETDMPSADDLAALFVSRLLAELPAVIPSPTGQRVVALLNGLGSVKYEELFVVYRAVQAGLQAVGSTVVDCEVGEVCTSFDMAGVSLTLLWLDDDLERLWAAPADAPAFRRGLLPAGVNVGATSESEDSTVPNHTDDESAAGTPIPTASEQSRRAAAVVAQIFARIAQTVVDNVEELGRIDAVAGDGDHGIGMERGATAAAAAARAACQGSAGAGTLISMAGEAWADRAGGTSGALWGLGLRAIGARIGDQAAPTPIDVAEAVAAARQAITTTGGAAVGDKTLVDALVPFDDTLTASVQADATLAEAWRLGADAATEAAAATRTLLPKVGRARPHAERSLGTPDAGAVSLALIVSRVADLLAERAAATSDPVNQTTTSTTKANTV
jgi:dihydroxyacetone kinase